MEKHLKASILLFISSLVLLVVTFTLPKATFNLSESKKRVTAYAKEGHYQRDLEAKVDEALAYLEKEKNKYEKPAIVFDIDETLISNFKTMLGNGYGGNAAWFRKQDLLAKSTRMPEVFRLFEKAKKENIAIFIITGRSENEVVATISNLKKVGYDGWHTILYWPEHSQQSIREFKASSRAQIEKQGYTILLNVGDQKSDLEGNHAIHAIKLPNPFYEIPSHRHRSLMPTVDQ